MGEFMIEARIRLAWAFLDRGLRLGFHVTFEWFGATESCLRVIGR